MNSQLVRGIVGCLAVFVLAAMLGCPKQETAEKDDAKAAVEESAAGALGEVSKAMSDVDVQAKLGAVAAAIKAGELDKAESILKELGDLKGLSDAMQSKIESSQAALDAAKAAGE